MQKRSFALYLGSMAAALADAGRTAADGPAKPVAPEPVRAYRQRAGRYDRNSIANPVPGGGNRERERMLRKIAAGQVKVDGD